MKTCFVDWSYQDILGRELLRQISLVFKEWLDNFGFDISTEEIIIIRNFGAVCSPIESSILQMGELKPHWIWYIFSQPSNRDLILLLQTCFISEIPEILFACSSAFKTYLGALDRKSLENWLVLVLDALICIPVSHSNSFINMWNFGVLNVLHSLLHFPKYSIKNEEILGWNADEFTLLGKEVLWNWSAEIKFFDKELRSKVSYFWYL